VTDKRDPYNAVRFSVEREGGFDVRNNNEMKKTLISRRAKGAD
jgi:hypothetical protein